MAKITFVSFLVLAVAVAALAAPSEKQFKEAEFQQELQPAVSAVDAPDSEPEPRITCDLLSGIGWGSTFCVAHCIALGFSGGDCNNQGVCVCRR